jgi:hypothetical protein
VGVVFAGALATFAATPAALAQDETSTSPTETTTSTSESSTTSPTTTTQPAPTAPSSTSGIATAAPSQSGDVRTTDKQAAPEKKAAPELKEDTQQPPKEDDYQDGVGHGFVGLGGEGILVVNCASGKVGAIYTQNLSVTSGPDQDESDGRLWNYSVTVVSPPAGPTGRFAFTCDGVESVGIVDFEQEQPPTTTTSSSAPSSTAPVTTPSVPSTTTTTATTTTAPGNAAPKAQVKVAPKGPIETGFGGMAW